MTTPTATHEPSRACYLRGCQHPACRDKHLRYCKQYGVRRHREGPRRIDATETATHLRALIADGWTQTGLEQATGVAAHTICGLVNGLHTQVYRDTAHTILAFRPDADADRPGHWTDPIGTIRRVRALACIGWPQYTVADAIGVRRATLSHVVLGNRQKVAKTTARAVADLYPTWMLRPGPSTTARGIARSRGWHGPLAWGADIDNPHARPDLTGIGHDEPGRRDPLRPVEIRHLAGFGYSAHEIAARVGLPKKDVESRLAAIRAERQAAA